MKSVSSIAISLLSSFVVACGPAGTPSNLKAFTSPSSNERDSQTAQNLTEGGTEIRPVCPPAPITLQRAAKPATIEKVLMLYPQLISRVQAHAMAYGRSTVVRSITINMNTATFDPITCRPLSCRIQGKILVGADTVLDYLYEDASIQCSATIGYEMDQPTPFPTPQPISTPTWPTGPSEPTGPTGPSEPTGPTEPSSTPTPTPTVPAN